jgi:hypothetical protein
MNISNVLLSEKEQNLKGTTYFKIDHISLHLQKFTACKNFILNWKESAF